ncbi:MAG: AI-2E family transporter [Anaerostipes sp.]|nr:AI-2E family transporter [Anaerostipes sp.]
MRRWEIYLEIFMELIVIIAGAFLLVFVLPRFLGFLWPFVAAAVITKIAHPLIDFLERHLKLPKRFGSALLIIGVIAAVIALVYFLVINTGREVLSFARNLPQTKEVFLVQWQSVSERLSSVVSSLPVSVQNQLNNAVGSVSQSVDKVASFAGNYGVAQAGTFAKNMTNGFIGTIVMFFASYVFIVDQDKFLKGYEKFVPKAIKDKIGIFYHNTLGVLGSYCLAQLKIMVIMIGILWIGFLIAGFKYRFILALLVSVVDIFPILGTGTVLIPWALFQLVTGEVRSAVILVAIYIVCLIVKQILQPKMMGDRMGISPLATIFLIYVGLKLGGLGGMLLALIVGIFVYNLYKLGIFDRKINFFRTRIEMLTLNSEKEEEQLAKEKKEEEDESGR